MPIPLASHVQKTNVALHFSCVNLRNTVGPLGMLWAACDTDASAIGIKLPKSHVVPHFDCLDLRNITVALTTLLASHDAKAGSNDVT